MLEELDNGYLSNNYLFFIKNKEILYKKSKNNVHPFIK